MYGEMTLTVVGRIVTDPTRRTAGTQDVVRFRMVCNGRRPLEDGNWEDASSLFVSVNCWGRLVTGVAASLKKGDAIIAVGTVHTNEYLNRDGVPRSSLELRATAVGPDLAHYIARLEKCVPSPGPEAVEPEDPETVAEVEREPQSA